MVGFILIFIFTHSLLFLVFAGDCFSQVVSLRLHLVFSVGLHGLVHHLFVQVAAADEVEVEKLEVLWRSVWINRLEEVIDFLVGLDTNLLDVLVVLHFLVQDLVLVESCKSRLSECKSHLIAQIELFF